MFLIRLIQMHVPVLVLLLLHVIIIAYTEIHNTLAPDFNCVVITVVCNK